MRFILAVLAFAGTLLPASATAHEAGEGSWINDGRFHNPPTNEWCCGEGDCFVIIAAFVHRVAGGYSVDAIDYQGNMHPELVPDAEVSPSVDDQFLALSRVFQ